MIRRLQLFLALGALPGAACGLLALRDQGWLCIGAAGYAVVLAGVAAFLFRSRSEVKSLVRAAAEGERRRAADFRELQARVDFLSAEREISLILNEDVDFRTIFERVLTITCDTLGGDAELWMREGEKLLRRAARVGGRTVFDTKGREDRRVRQCFEAGRMVFEAEEGRFHALAPLQADREIVGVVRITTPLEGDAEARQERSRILARHLDEFSKFLALSLKTPDLYTRAVQDGLTGLWTKRHFLARGREAMEGAMRYGEPLSLIMVDIDHFKKVNDTHGHQTGDRVLKGVAQILLKRVRGGSAFRYGGEEMAVLMPKTDAEGAAQVAERLRKGIDAHKIGGVKVTASFGVAEIDETMRDPGDLVERADVALYKAKESGRNRVVTSHRVTESRRRPQKVSR